MRKPSGKYSRVKKSNIPNPERIVQVCVKTKIMPDPAQWTAITNLPTFIKFINLHANLMLQNKGTQHLEMKFNYFTFWCWWIIHMNFEHTFLYNLLMQQ